MASYPGSIHRIQAASAFGSGLIRSPLSRWFKALSVLYGFPRIVRFIALELTNEVIEGLTPEQAKELYPPLAVLHREIGWFLDRAQKMPAVIRFILRPWLRAITRDTERIGDVAEALALGSDPELRKAISMLRYLRWRPPLWRAKSGLAWSSIMQAKGVRKTAIPTVRLALVQSRFVAALFVAGWWVFR